MINQKKNKKVDETTFMNKNLEIAQVYKGFNNHRVQILKDLNYQK